MDASHSGTIRTADVLHEYNADTGVHRIILNRPHARNAISRRLLHELDLALNSVLKECATTHDVAGLFPDLNIQNPLQDHRLTRKILSATEQSPPLTPPDQAKEMSSARCLIFQSSSDKAFCAGADLVERREMNAEEVISFLSELRRVVDKIASFPVPTIAALGGPALGGGLELALACDFRVASFSNPAQLLFGLPECRLGIIPGAGGTQRAPRIVGLSRAKELVYTGRILTAIEAHEWGMIDYLCEEGITAVERADALAEQMLQSAPLALAAAKAAIAIGIDMEMKQALAWETTCYQTLLPTHDRREALLAFSEKRKPHFLGC